MVLGWAISGLAEITKAREPKFFGKDYFRLSGLFGSGLLVPAATPCEHLDIERRRCCDHGATFIGRVNLDHLGRWRKACFDQSVRHRRGVLANQVLRRCF